MLLFIAANLRADFRLLLRVPASAAVRACVCVREMKCFALRLPFERAAIARHYSQFAVDLPLSAPFLVD